MLFTFVTTTNSYLYVYALPLTIILDMLFSAVSSPLINFIPYCAPHPI